MSNFRDFVLSLCVVCLGVGCASSQADGPVEVASTGQSEPNPVVLNGVEICGPIYDALIYLGPKNEDGQLDVERIAWEWAWSEHPTVYLPVPTHLIRWETLHKASSVRLDEFEGRVASVSLMFELGAEENSSIWDDLYGVLQSAPGPPLTEKDEMFYREHGPLHTGAIRSESMEIVMFAMSCLPLKEDFLAALDAAKAAAEEVEEAAHDLGSESGNVAASFLGKTVLDVILIAGQPDREPVWEGSHRVGMYFDRLGLYDTPTKEWVWFVDGKSVYVGWDFPPPFSPDDVVRNFFSFREELIESMGEPVESVGGWMDERFQARWRDGDFETVLTLEDTTGFPRFLIEFIDRGSLEVIDFDLRPDQETIEQVAMLHSRLEPQATEE